MFLWLWKYRWGLIFSLSRYFFKLTCILHRYFSLEHTFVAFWFVQIQGIQVFSRMVSVFDPFGELRLDTTFHEMIPTIGHLPNLYHRAWYIWLVSQASTTVPLCSVSRIPGIQARSFHHLKTYHSHPLWHVRAGDIFTCFPGCHLSWFLRRWGSPAGAKTSLNSTRENT